MPDVPRALAVSAAVVALLAPGAGAQEPGVTIDPDSPSGKEYALPIDSARRRAAPDGDAGFDAREGRPAPLFGSGVGDGGEGGSRGGSGGEPDRRPDRDTSSSTGPATRPGSGAEAAGIDVRAATATPSGGAASLAAIAGGALGVVVLGAAAGVALRRRTR